ncbi:MAG: UDP-glucose 4-epimerase [Pelagibacterales bacterium]|nr:UDP-glucose 4-epimerase [Pelagibacterales bacterium]
MKKNILITGVAGFIGSKVAARFKKENYNIFGVDDLSTGSLKNIPKGIKFIKADISNKKAINLLPKECYQILHLAGQSSGEISFEDPINDLNKNTSSTLNLIDYGIKKKVKLFLYASSMSVYGKLLKKKANEQDVCEPLSCYGVSKLTSEKYLKLFCKKLPFIGLRMFNVYGPGQNMNNLKQGMVSIYLAQALKNKKIIIKGSLNRVRDFIFIDDVVDAWFKASLLKKNLNQNINIGSGIPTSVKELVELITHKIKKTNFLIVKGTKGDQDFICSNNKLSKKIFNKKEFISLDLGLDKFIHFLNKYR